VEVGLVKTISVSSPTVKPFLIRQRRWVRFLFLGGFLSYRALFNWLNPWAYLLTVWGAPAVQIIFFTYLGRHAMPHFSANYFIIGNAIQASAMVTIFGMMGTIVNERGYGTLQLLLASPASRLAVVLGRSILPMLHGVLVVIMGLLLGAVALGLDLSRANLTLLAVSIAVGVFSCNAFGIIFGGIGLWEPDVDFLWRFGYFMLLLLCGVNFPVQAFPTGVRVLSNNLPLTHSITAARLAVAGASFTQVRGLLIYELGLGIAYTIGGYLLFLLFEHLSRKEQRRKELD
jgi:ABC-2 type transport system permease protein